MYVTISYRTPAMFFGTQFGNFGLETRAVLFKTALLYCKFKGNMILVFIYRYFLQTWFRSAVNVHDIERSCGENKLFKEEAYEAVLANNQLDAPFQCIYLFIYLFISLHVSSSTVLIIRRSNCINKFRSSLMTGRPSTQVHRRIRTRWCINTIRSLDDEHCASRNM
jgi:hypothetical protein